MNKVFPTTRFETLIRMFGQIPNRRLWTGGDVTEQPLAEWKLTDKNRKSSVSVLLFLSDKKTKQNIVTHLGNKLMPRDERTQKLTGRDVAVPAVSRVGGAWPRFRDRWNQLAWLRQHTEPTRTRPR